MKTMLYIQQNKWTKTQTYTNLHIPRQNEKLEWV